MSSDGANTLRWSDLVDQAANVLCEKLGGDRRQEARWLVERVSGYESSDLIVNAGELVSTRSVARFDQMLGRRGSGEPLQYVLGRWQFRALELYVDSNVLIPRPETEIVAGLAIGAALAVRDRPPLIADLGTGSGAIALSVASEVPTAQVWATDLSPGALRVARANAGGLGRRGANVTTLEGSWFEPLPRGLLGQLDVVVSNPPYIGEDERAGLPAEVRDWEPHLALFADDEGRAHVAHLIDVAPTWLRPGGSLVIEMAPRQTEWASERARTVGYSTVRIVKDLAGRERALLAVLESR